MKIKENWEFFFRGSILQLVLLPQIDDGCKSLLINRWLLFAPKKKPKLFERDKSIMKSKKNIARINLHSYLHLLSP
jgi:hypothetical protein